MTFSRWQISALLALVLSVAAVGCSDNSSGGGAGGSLASGGARKDAGSTGGVAGTVGAGGVKSTGGVAGTVGAGGVKSTGGVTASGGAGGSDAAGIDGAVALDAARDSVVTPIDAAVDSPIQPIDAPQALDAPIGVDGGGATLAQIKSLIAGRCAGCHTGTGTAAARLNLSDSVDAGSTLYARLVGPLLLETYCGENIDAGGDAAQARRAIVAGDPASSFLYLKITGTEPSPGSPPANCGVRMPRVFIPGIDGGAGTSVACDTLDGGAAANCLGAADIDLVRQWILEGAPQ
jgi:hypothetical protein